MTATITLIIVALIAYCVFQYWEYINPYVDEPVEEMGMIVTMTGVYKKTKYKRTWKNGKVEYIIKKDRT